MSTPHPPAGAHHQHPDRSQDRSGAGTAAPALQEPGTARRDADLLRRAAVELRHAATQDTYRGMTHPEHAYALASILDSFSIHHTHDDLLRAELRRCATTLLTPRPPTPH